MNFSSGYIYLFLAIILGISANGFLKTTNGFTNIFPTIFCVTSIVLCLFCLSKAMNIIPVGFTYATYGGLTITAVTLFGVFKFFNIIRPCYVRRLFKFIKFVFIPDFYVKNSCPCLLPV